MLFESRPPVLVRKGLLKVRRKVLIEFGNDSPTLRGGIFVAACAEGVDTLRARHVEHGAADPELANSEKSTSRMTDLFRLSGKCSSLCAPTV